MSIIKEGATAVGKFLAPGAAKVIERYGSKPEEGSRLGLLGKDILRSAFPGVYAVTDKLKLTGGKRKPKKNDKQSPVTESVSELTGEVVEKNTILTSAIEIQTQQNIILTEILKALKEGKGAGGGPDIDMPDVPNLRRGGGGKGKGGRTGVGGKKGKGGKGKPTVARDPKTGKFAKIKPTIGSRVATGAGNVLKAGGKLVSSTPVVGGLISAGIEYSESGNAGRAAAAGGGAVAGSAIGTAIGAGAGALLGGVGAVPLGWVGGILGGIAGGEIGKLGYDMFGDGDDQKDKKEQKFDTQYITYNAEDIKFKSNLMSIKAREFTIKGDVGGLNLGAGSSEPGILPGVASGDADDRQRAIDDISSKLKRSRPGAGNLQGFNVQPGIDTRVNQGIIDKLKGLQSSIPGMIITSGYRDPARNAAAGGAMGSQHLQGNAVDIYFPGGGIEETVKVIEAASAAGIGGIGVYGPGKLHLDTGSRRAWGPTYKAESVPPWAVEAIQKHTGMKGYAGGTNNVPQTGPAVVGEKGSELVVGKNGVSVTPNQAAVVNLNQGDQVITSKGWRGFTKYLTGKENKGIYSRPAFKQNADEAEGFKSKTQQELGYEKHIIDIDWKLDPENNDLGRTAIPGIAGSTDVSQGDLNKWYEKMGLKKKLVDQMYEGERYQTSRQDLDEASVQRALTSGQLIDKPATMTQREFSNRIKDYALPAVASGALSVDDYKYHSRTAEQPQYLTNAQNTAKGWIENEKKRDAPKVRPLELPEDYHSTKMLGALFGNAN